MSTWDEAEANFYGTVLPAFVTQPQGETNMLTVPMVGATFRPADAKEIVRNLRIGDRVKLVADPDNQYDTTAVAVYSDDVHIGFIPKESNSALFAVLVDGAEIDAEVIAFENSLKPILEIDFYSSAYDNFKPVSSRREDLLDDDEVPF